MSEIEFASGEFEGSGGLFHIRQHSLPLHDNGINPLFYPQKLCLQLDDIEIWEKELNPANPVALSNCQTYVTCPLTKSTISRVAFCYRDQRQIRHAFPYDGNVKFDMSYHSLIFDVIKVNLLKKCFQSHGKYAQATIKLSELESFKDGAHIIKFPLVEYKNKENRIGTVSILLQFYDFLLLDYSALFDERPMTCEPDEMTQSSMSISQPSSVTSSSSNMASDDTDNQTEYFTASASCDNSNVSFTPSWKEDDGIVKQMRTHSLSSISYESHESTKLGMASLKSLIAGLTATGWNIPTVDIPRSLSLMGRYYRAYTTPKTGDIVVDIDKLKEAEYFLNFIMPVYGPMARKFFGHGSTADLIKNSRKIAIEHLQIKESHMLAWEYSASKLFSSKPSFYVCFDENRNAIHVCVRGTYNVQEVFTDINCEFAPFIGGTAHKGMLQSALWIREHYYEKIKVWIRDFNATSLHLSGHSLGGSVASILLMLIQNDLLQELSPSFKFKVYSFAPAPCVSPDLIADYQPFIESFINKHDPVPTLSYGALMDFKEMLVHAAKISKDSSMSKEEQLEDMYKFATNLRKSNKHPRLLVTGQIYFMYKNSKPPSFFQKVSGRAASSGDGVGYVVERSIPEYFDHLHLKFDMMYHHIPPIYHNSLKKAIKQLEKLQ